VREGWLVEAKAFAGSVVEFGGYPVEVGGAVDVQRVQRVRVSGLGPITSDLVGRILVAFCANDTAVSR
jgi:hypothetical protein